MTVLIKATSATVTVYRGHRQALFYDQDYLPDHRVQLLEIILW